MAARRAAFPVGLYGALLFALCWLMLPELLRPLERLLLGVACLPQRFLSHAGGQPALAADSRTAQRLAELQQGLFSRSREHDIERARSLLPPGLEPMSCRVRAVEDRRRGGGGGPCELVLDRSYQDLAGCSDIVTCGDVLLGFLARPGIGAAQKDRPEDPARVMLLNHPQSRQVAVGVALAAGPPLHCVVGPAAIVDPVPLRTTLHDDPYRAAKLQHGDAPVRTLAIDAPWIGAVPKGLLVGHTRVWGYDIGDDTLTIGLFVAPPLDARAIPQVVLWQSIAGIAETDAPPPMAPARAFALPDGTGGRWLVTAAGALPDGAAVVQDGVCLGSVRAIAFGQGLCTAFAASRHAWSLWLLPDDPRLPPRGLYGEVAHASASAAWFAVRGDQSEPPAGFVFTGSNGPFCPAGLLIGRAEPDRQARLLRITVPARRGAQQVEVVVGGR